MDYVKKRTHIIGHVRFLEAGPIARDLYDWGMLWSGQQETDGAIPMAAVLASPWGAGGKKNVVVAQKLVEVGLWDRTDTGYRILRWSEQGNATKAEMEGKRSADRAKKAAERKRRAGQPANSEPLSDVCPLGTPLGSPTDFDTSPSTSLSGSDLQGGAGGARVLRPDEPLTDQRRNDHEASAVPPRAIDPEWRNYVDDRIARSMLFGSPGAIDADWRKWVRRQNAYDAKARQNVYERGRRTDTRQPLGDPNAKWLKTGSDL